jgi:hypothetical protein
MTRRRDDEPTDAEIDRSQAMLGAILDDDGVTHVFGPGVHYDMPAVRYFADCCERPSLTQSIAKLLIERSPAHAWVAHPRLNKNWKPDDATKYDVGNIAHRLLLGRGKDLLIVEYDDWRTKEARAVREDACANGKLAILEKHHRMGDAIARAARSQLNAIGWPLTDGKAEVVLIADDGSVTLRAMVDWLVHPGLCFDLKTTGLSVAPAAIPAMMVNAGWDVQAAMQERILDILDPPGRGRRMFRFIAIEDEPPYALTPVELTEAVMTLGRKKLSYAIDLWRRCIKTDTWPAYATEVCRPEYPAWQESRWLDREVAESERPRALHSLMGG